MLENSSGKGRKKMRLTLAQARESADTNLRRRRWAGKASQFSSAISANREILLFLVAIYLLRTFMASRNSYWLDELYSIFRYGSENPTLADAVSRLAEHSIHPPLYQSILYVWMSIWGDSEFSTRALSNLFITAASLTLYALLRLMWHKTPSFVGAVLFALSYPAMVFGLEARSYGLTILLVTVSSLAFLRAILEQAHGKSKPASAYLVFGGFTNTCLLLTHYYNLFWVGSQVLFFLIFSIFAGVKGKQPRTLGLVFWGGILPVALFLATWGRVFFSQLANRTSEWSIGKYYSDSLIDSFFFLVVEPNLRGVNFDWRHTIDENSLGGLFAIFSLSVLLFVAVFLTFFARRQMPSLSYQERLVTVYLIFWLVVPIFLAFLGFTIIGAERFLSRYFLYSTIAFFPVLLGVLMLIGRALFRGDSTNGFFRKTVSGVLVGALLLVSIAGGYRGATRQKDDWRGISQQVVQSSSQIGSRDFRVIAMVNKKIPGAEELENYYFSKMSHTVRLDFAYSRAEAIVEDYSELRAFIERGDKSEVIYVMFTHNKASAFPGMMEFLNEELVPVFSDLSASGAGIVVFEHK